MLQYYQENIYRQNDENDRNIFVIWSQLSQDVRNFVYFSGDLSTIKMKVVKITNINFLHGDV